MRNVRFMWGQGSIGHDQEQGSRSGHESKDILTKNQIYHSLNMAYVLYVILGVEFNGDIYLITKAYVFLKKFKFANICNMTIMKAF